MSQSAASFTTDFNIQQPQLMRRSGYINFGSHRSVPQEIGDQMDIPQCAFLQQRLEEDMESSLTESETEELDNYELLSIESGLDMNSKLMWTIRETRKQAISMQETRYTEKNVALPNDDQGYHFVAMGASGDALGVVSLFPSKDGKSAHLRQFAVLIQGKGVGNRLLRALISKASEIGMSTVFLTASETVVGFYRKHGFQARPGAEYVKKAGYGDVHFLNMKKIIYPKNGNPTDAIFNLGG